MGHAAIEVNDGSDIEALIAGAFVIAAVAILQTNSRSGPVFTKDGDPSTEEKLEPIKRQVTEEKIFMKQTWRCHSAFRIEAGEAKILIDPFLSDNPSRDNGWSGHLIGKNSTQGGDR